MVKEKWQKINELFHAALEIEADKRMAFIKTESDDDDEVFAEVEKLISAHEESENFIEKPMAENALKVLSNQNNSTIISQQNLLNGKKIGHFEIIAPIGKGGMGEVYLAHDKTLGRDVAIKVLLPEFTADENRLKRFQLEAKAVSALNHPNILTIYEIGESDNLHFIATEFVKGQTLSEYLRKEKTSLKIALQIISALQAAHEAGIVHRDIKPDNIMIRHDGIVKVLDFGLAKLLENSNNQKSKIKNQKSTMPGLIMGTPNYMSPEQARGKDIDFQTDIFSFGIALYEMLSGKLPFQGETVNDTIAAILTKEPKSVCEINPEIPPELEKIVSKCLQKDKQNRYQTAKSVFDDLNELTEELQAQDRLEKSFVPNSEEAKTQVLRLTTVDEKGETVATKNIKKQPQSLKKYVVAGLTAILLAVAGFFGYNYLKPSKQIDSIAVIPFINKTNNAEMEYLSDGMTETLINSLSKIPNLNVKARSSVFRYKGNEKDFKKIAEELKVQGILTGEVIQRGDQLILKLELFDTNTENQIWGESYTRKQSDVVNLQNEIAKDVSKNLQAKLTGEQTAKIANSGTTNSEAFQAYLKGRYFASKGSNDGQEQSLKYFQEAVNLDPNFAQGYASLASAYTLLGTILRSSMSAEEAIPNARIAVEKAIALNPNLSEVYTSLAWLKFRVDWDWAGAERDFKRAIELNPNNAQAHQWYGELLSCLLRHDEAIVELKKAVENEPFSVIIVWNLGKVYMAAGRYDEAIVYLKKSLELDGTMLRGWGLLNLTYLKKGMEVESLEAFLKGQEVLKTTPARIEIYKKIFKEKGMQAVRAKELEFQFEDRRFNITPLLKMAYYANMQDKENTLQNLEEGYRTRNGSMVSIQIESSLDFVRDEPRYQEIVKKMNFPQ